MKQIAYLGLKTLLVSGLVVGLAVVGKKEMDYRKGKADYDSAKELAGLLWQDGRGASGPEEAGDMPKGADAKPSGGPADPFGATLAKLDLAALQEVNPDVVGWIAIPGSNLSYPLLQGEDNEYYLNHTWKKEANSVGAIYLDCRVNEDLEDFNTIVYGHRMRNLSMFGALKYYEGFSYWEEHPYVYIVVNGGVYRYHIYSAYEAALDQNTYGIGIARQETKEDFIRYGLGHSVIDTGVAPSADGHVLTLSTCTGDGHSTRWVVQAVRDSKQEIRPWQQ